MREQMLQRQSQPELSDPQPTGEVPTGESPDDAEERDLTERDGGLPAWVGIHETLVELVEKMHHKLQPLYMTEALGADGAESLDIAVHSWLAEKTLCQPELALKPGRSRFELLPSPLVAQRDSSLEMELISAAATMSRSAGGADGAHFESSLTEMLRPLLAAWPADLSDVVQSSFCAASPFLAKKAEAVGPEVETLSRAMLEELPALLAPALVTSELAKPCAAAPLATSVLHEAVASLKCAICQETPYELKAGAVAEGERRSLADWSNTELAARCTKYPVTTTCGHSFCSVCFDSTCMSGSRRCPLCREPIGSIARYVRPNRCVSDLLEAVLPALEGDPPADSGQGESSPSKGKKRAGKNARAHGGTAATAAASAAAAAAG